MIILRNKKYSLPELQEDIQEAVIGVSPNKEIKKGAKELSNFVTGGK